MTELESRIQLAREMQSASRIKSPAIASQSPRNKRFTAIDRKHSQRKIKYFPEERKYAMPQHISGNARNRLIFGQIHWIDEITETYENELSLIKSRDYTALHKHYGYRK